MRNARTCSTFALALFAAVAVLSESSATGQTRPDETRDMIDGSLLQARRKPPGRPKPQMYAPRRAAQPARVAPSPDAVAARTPAAEIGLTLWKFRSSEPADDVKGFVTVQSSGTAPARRVEMTPVRVESTAAIRIGEYVRLTIEAPRSGRLYLIGRDRGPRGYIGPPIQLFPQRPGDDNAVAAGKPVSVPTWNSAGESYFTLSKAEGQDSMEVIVIITPEDLSRAASSALGANLKVQTISLGMTPAEIARLERDGLSPVTEVYALDDAQVDRLVAEWSVVPVWLDRQDGLGAAYTRRELDASLNSGASLSQDDPPPQTIVRFAPRGSAPWLVKLSFRVE
jgi:hypothetical protein